MSVEPGRDTDPFIGSATAWRNYLLLAAIQVAAVMTLLLVSLVRPGRETAGFATGEAILSGCLLLILLACIWVLIRSWRNPTWFERQVVRLNSYLSRRAVFGSLVLICLVGLFFGIYQLHLTSAVQEIFTRTALERSQPLILLICGMCVQTLVWLYFGRSGFHLNRLARILLACCTFLVVLLIFFYGWNWLAQNTFASEAPQTGWNDLGAPIMETQALLAWMAGMGLLAVIAWQRRIIGKYPWGRYLSPRVVDAVICVALWVCTVLLWNSQPIYPNWFVAAPRQPNYEYYPNSDALAYDMSAQLLMVGEKLQFLEEPFVRRPIHALYLTILHVIGGQDYQRVVFLQILVLAFLPVMIYLLTRKIYTRPAGLIAGVLVMLREANSIASAARVTSANAKLFMADLPATLAVVCFVYLFVIWIKDTDRKQLYALISGAALGISMLIRQEVGIMLLGAVFILVFVFWKRPGQFIRQFSLFLLGAFLILSPWVWRNWQLTGKIFLDTPNYRGDLIEQRFGSPEGFAPPGSEKYESSRQPELLAHRLTTPVTLRSLAVSTWDTPTPTPISPPEQPLPESDSFFSVLGRVVEFYASNRVEVGRMVLSHAMNSQIQMLLLLPSNYRFFNSAINALDHGQVNQFGYECCLLLSYTRGLPYWHKWDGIIPRQSILPIAINIFLVGLGTIMAWKRNKIIGLTPVIFAMTYLLLNALLRNSGGRYILPIDWIAIVYFSIGLTRVSLWLINQFTTKPVMEDLPEDQPAALLASDPQNRPLLRTPQFYGALIVILLVGWSLPVVERAIPPRYTGDMKAGMLNSLIQSELLSEMERAAIEDLFLANARVEVGRALYPRYFPSGEGERGTNNPMGALPFRRVGFYLVGPDDRPIVMPFEKKAEYFQNASDVVIISQPDGTPAVVGVFDSTGNLKSILVAPASR